MTSTFAVRSPDQVSRTTPLGLRFWDALDGRFVCDHDLIVRGRRPNTATELLANVTTSGVYAFHGLPWLRDVEHGAGDDAFWAANPPSHPLDIEVIDLASRFQPFAMSVQIPIKGVLAWECAGDVFESPLSPLGAAAIPLMSAPTRTAQPPRCSIRAELWDASDPQESRWRPAAWAVLEIRFGTRLRVRSFADARGCVFVPFGFPEIGPEVPIDSPLSPPAGPRPAAEFTAELSVRWEPGASTTRAPDLCTTLSQSAATAWSDTTKSNPLDRTTLQTSEQVILGSTDSSGRRSSRLLITA